MGIRLIAAFSGRLGGHRLRSGDPNPTEVDHVTTTTRMRKGALWLAATGAAALGLAAGASGAEASVTSAQADKLQREIDTVLRHAGVGARQIAPNRVTWRRDGVTLTIPVPGTARVARARGDCRLKRACVWEHADFLGRRLSFLHYGTFRLAPLRPACGHGLRRLLVLQPPDGRRMGGAPHPSLGHVHDPGGQVRQPRRRAERPGHRDLADALIRARSETPATAVRRSHARTASAPPASATRRRATARPGPPHPHGPRTAPARRAGRPSPGRCRGSR